MPGVDDEETVTIRIDSFAGRVLATVLAGLLIAASIGTYKAVVSASSLADISNQIEGLRADIKTSLLERSALRTEIEVFKANIQSFIQWRLEVDADRREFRQAIAELKSQPRKPNQ